MVGAKPAAREAYFGTDLLAFLRELARNNNREWFTRNKSRYESSVRDPCLEFIRGVEPELRRVSPYLVVDARPVGGSLSRIYRDIRFSKDKSPYKTSVGIHFPHRATGEVAENLPGFYLHLEPGDSHVYSGIWRPEPTHLQKIRETIVARLPDWRRVIRQVPPLEGESLKRPPFGFAADHPAVEDLKRKDFITGAAVPDSLLTGRNFGPVFGKLCASIDPLNRFLARAVGIPW